MLANREDIQQSLCRVLVRAVSGVDHSSLEMFREQVRSSRTAMSHDNKVDSHRLNVPRGIDEGLTFGNAAARSGEVDGISAQAFGREAEARPRPCRWFEEEVRDDGARECFELGLTFGRESFELGCLIENLCDLGRGQFLKTEKMFAGPNGSR